MRPQAGSELSPSDLFCEVALLISEARLPDPTDGSRGSREGLHCPVISSAVIHRNGGINHVCEENNIECNRAMQLTNDLRRLWVENIPAIIQVVLLADICEQQSDHGLVIEQWTLTVQSQKISGERPITCHFLLQAVRSFLHFSQLSAWLSTSQGKFPNNVVYRLGIPGETSPASSGCYNGASHHSNFVSHSFPHCHIGKQKVLSVDVKLIDRNCEVPRVVCHCVQPSCSSPCKIGDKNLIDSQSVHAEPYQDLPSAISVYGLRDNRNKQSGDDDRNNDCLTPSIESASGNGRQMSLLTPLTSFLGSPLSEAQTVSSFSDQSYQSSPISNVLIDEDIDSSATVAPTGVFLNSQSCMLPASVAKITHPNDAMLDAQTSASNPLFCMPADCCQEITLRERIEALQGEVSRLSHKLKSMCLPKETQLTPEKNCPMFFIPDSDDAQNNGCQTESHGSPRADCCEDFADESLSKRKAYYCKSDVSSEQNAAIASHRRSAKILFSKDTVMLPGDEEQHKDETLELCAALPATAVRLSDNHSGRVELDGKVAFCVGERPELDGFYNPDLCSFESSINKRQASNSAQLVNHAMPTFSKSENMCYRSVGQKSQDTKHVFHGNNISENQLLNSKTGLNYAQFNRRTGLPLSSSPAPRLKRNQHSFDFDISLTTVLALKSALQYDHESGSSDSEGGVPLCKSAPASTNLLGNFEESALNGRLKPFGAVEGFTVELGASGAFCPPHVTLPVTTFFFDLSEDNSPSPYLGHCSLESLGRKGYYVPKKGSIQITLFNPHGTVVKMFVVCFDLSEMPPGCQTFVRQRTFFMPASASLTDAMKNRTWLRYLIHLRFASSRSGKLYLHTDIRMLFSRKSEQEASALFREESDKATNDLENYELRSFTEMPKNPKFSPRKLNRNDSRTVLC